MEARADKVSVEHEAQPGAFVRALETLHRVALMPAVLLFSVPAPTMETTVTSDGPGIVRGIRRDARRTASLGMCRVGGHPAKHLEAINPAPREAADSSA